MNEVVKNATLTGELKVGVEPMSVKALAADCPKVLCIAIRNESANGGLRKRLPKCLGHDQCTERKIDFGWVNDGHVGLGPNS